jgi:hypothetical protein
MVVIFLVPVLLGVGRARARACRSTRPRSDVVPSTIIPVGGRHAATLILRQNLPGQARAATS